MENIQSFLVPVVVSIISAVVIALLTIQIKYAETKDDALNGLKSLASKALSYLWVGYLIYSLYHQVVSQEPLTRGDVLSIAIYTACLFSLVTFHFMNRLIAILMETTHIQEHQLDLLEKIMLKQDNK